MAAPAGLDPCAAFWVRPDRDFVDHRTCKRGPLLGEIAAQGGLVSLGSKWDVTESRSPFPPPRRCEGPATHAQNRAFLEEIRALRPAGAPPLASVQLHRFDLVPIPFAAQPGFDAAFLVRTLRPWSAVVDFFAVDASRPCREGGCAWSDSFLGDPRHDAGPRLRDHIDRTGGKGAYRSVVYYLSSASPSKKVYWPDAALGDLRHPGYRAWRVAEAARALEAGGYDAIMLNHKFDQYLPRGGHCIGSEAVPDVEALAATRTTLWSAPPDGYGYPEYVAGWAALGRDLRAAGVPYAVWLSDAPWRTDFSDAASTPDVDEGELVRETARGARFFLITGPTTSERVARIGAELAPGGRIVLTGRARDICPVPGPTGARANGPGPH